MEKNRINYKPNVKFHDMAKKPVRQWRFLTWLIYVLSKIVMHKKYKLEKINMEGVKAPYVILSNHAAFADLEINGIATYPNRCHNIASLEGHHKRAWIMEPAGCIGKRKYTADPYLLKACQTILNDYKAILTIYPEERYTPIGTTARLPQSYGSFLKYLKQDVVILLHRGNHLRAPFWGWRNKRRVVTHSTMKKVIDKSELDNLTAEQVMEIITRELQYDEYKYQKDNNILITEKKRAEGLHEVLYQCPHCKTEHEMSTKGHVLRCDACGKEWELTETGELKAREGETEFPHIPDWFEWERENVNREIAEGKYHYEDEVELYGYPNTKRFIPLGKARVTHTYEKGFTVEGTYNGQDFVISRPSIGLYALHVEYDYPYIVHGVPLFQLSTSNDTFVCIPKKKEIVTKLSFATEELYRLAKEAKDEKRRQREAEREKQPQ